MSSGSKIDNFYIESQNVIFIAVQYWADFQEFSLRFEEMIKEKCSWATELEKFANFLNINNSISYLTF